MSISRDDSGCFYRKMSFSSRRPRNLDSGRSYFNNLIETYIKIINSFFFSNLLTHEGSHREVYQDFQPGYDIFRRWCQGLIRPQVPCTPSLHCLNANSASTQSQQPV